jgi:hypothetical protein
MRAEGSNKSEPEDGPSLENWRHSGLLDAHE